MKLFNKIKEHFRKQTPEQVFSFCLFVGCFALMLFCAIVRLCGGLWFTADITTIEEPSKFCKDVIMGALFVFEATFIYKILCRTKWIYCFLIGVGELILFQIFKNQLVSNIINLAMYFIVPYLFQRKLWTLLETLIVYLFLNLYTICFLYGRIGFVDGKQGYNFITSILGSIDYKLFIVSLYLYIKNFKGIKLWKIRLLV